MASRFAPTSVLATTSKGENNVQAHKQAVSQNRTTTTNDPGEITTTGHPARTITEQSSGITTVTHGTKGDLKTETVIDDAGFKLSFSVEINGGLNAGGSAPALP